MNRQNTRLTLWLWNTKYTETIDGLILKIGKDRLIGKGGNNFNVSLLVVKEEVREPSRKEKGVKTRTENVILSLACCYK